MRTQAAARADDRFPISRHYVPLYRDDEPNHCPGCGRQHWIIGRMTAECGFCGSAILLERFSTWSASPRIACRAHQPDERPDYLRAVC